jgi:hypothetical protein
MATDELAVYKEKMKHTIKLLRDTTVKHEAATIEMYEEYISKSREIINEAQRHYQATEEAINVATTMDELLLAVQNDK